MLEIDETYMVPLVHRLQSIEREKTIYFGQTISSGTLIDKNVGQKNHFLNSKNFH